MSAAVLSESIVLVTGTLLWFVVIIRASISTRERPSSVQGDPAKAEYGTRSLDRNADNPYEKSMRTSGRKALAAKLGI